LESLVVNGGKALKGQIKVGGAKNAILPIMAASLLSSSQVLLSGVPDLEDIKVMADALTILGARIKREQDTLLIDGRNIQSCELPEEISRKMRASNLVMGALLARFGFARVAYSGGCAIGSRPVDLHLKGFNNLGYRVWEKGGFMIGEGRPKTGREILLDFPSVGATENLIMAASTVPGTTIIRNAAREPEIIDLQNFLNRMGARIKGAGLDSIRIEGVSKFGGINHVVIPDRIEAGTFMIAAAITRGDVLIENVACEHIQPLAAKLREIGVEIMTTSTGVRVMGSRCLRPADFKTMPYPGFPTDMQPQTMALLSTIKGTSIVVETIFENRYMHVPELRRMGAEIKIEGRVAIIKGRDELEGASVEASDLRAGAALILAGLYARGQTEISNIRHIDRGYENIHLKLKSVGADINRRQN
jgi:UDP-N-acetylglucosamine 1-carboxyvinyltransferase